MKIVKIQFHDFHQLISTKRLNILSLLQREVGDGGVGFAAPAAGNGNDFDSLILGSLITTKALPHLASF